MFKKYLSHKMPMCKGIARSARENDIDNYDSCVSIHKNNNDTFLFHFKELTKHYYLQSVCRGNSFLKYDKRSFIIKLEGARYERRGARRDFAIRMLNVLFVKNTLTLRWLLVSNPTWNALVMVRVVGLKIGVVLTSNTLCIVKQLKNLSSKNEAGKN